VKLYAVLADDHAVHEGQEEPTPAVLGQDPEPLEHRLAEGFHRVPPGGSGLLGDDAHPERLRPSREDLSARGYLRHLDAYGGRVHLLVKV